MIKHAGFFHSSEEKQFSYEYLSGTHLLQTLTKPNNMSLTLSFETQRDLLTGMAYKRGSTGVASRTYTYDAAGRPITRNTSLSFSHIAATRFEYDAMGNEALAIAGTSAHASH